MPRKLKFQHRNKKFRIQREIKAACKIPAPSSEKPADNSELSPVIPQPAVPTSPLHSLPSPPSPLYSLHSALELPSKWSDHSKRQRAKNNASQLIQVIVDNRC